MLTLKNIFKGLFSNQACIDNRKMKWYLTLLLVVLAVFLPWIPNLSSGYQKNGGAIFSSPNYEVDTALKHMFNKEEYFKQIKVMENGENLELDYRGLAPYAADKESDTSNWENEFNGTNLSPLYVFEQEYGSLKSTVYFDAIGATITEETEQKNSDGSITIVTEEKRRVYLQAYFIQDLSSTTAGFNDYVTSFIDGVILDKNVATGELKKDPTSFAIFAKDYVAFFFYSFAATKASASPAASYVGNLSLGLKALGAQNGVALIDLLKGEDPTSDGMAGFVSLTHEASRPYLIKSVWMNILTLSCVTVISILVAAVLIIIFFKKKNSLYREANFFHAINTAVGMSLTGSLLAMIFGFFNPSYCTMIIIGALLIRSVFSMNKISPVPGASGKQDKPIYQARS